jgi:hypothetical protein
MPPPPPTTTVAGGVNFLVPPGAARRPGRQARAVADSGRAVEGRQHVDRERGTVAARKQGRSAPSGAAASRPEVGLDNHRDKVAKPALALDVPSEAAGPKSRKTRPGGVTADSGSTARRGGRARAKGRRSSSVAPAPGGVEEVVRSPSRTEQKRQLVHRLRSVAHESGPEMAALLGRVAWKLSTCGSSAIPTTDPGAKIGLKMRPDGTGRHLSGVMHCNRVLCPCCSAYIVAGRLEQLRPLVEENKDKGRHLFLTLTLRHHMGVEWGELASALKASWKELLQQRRFRESVQGGIRQDETTWGQHGHHFHSHIVLTLEEGIDPSDFTTWFQARFAQAATRRERTCEWREGWWSEVSPDRLVDAVAYTQKPGGGLEHLIGAELLAGGTKGGSRPWDLPDDVYAEVWRASKGHRWFSSFGIWRLRKDDEKKTDEQVAAETREATGEEVRSVPVSEWKRLSPTQADLLQGLVLNPRLAREQALRAWDCFWLVLGQSSGPAG